MHEHIFGWDGSGDGGGGGGDGNDRDGLGAVNSILKIYMNIS